MKLLFLTLILSAMLHAADVNGAIVDPAGHPIPGAQVALVNSTGIITQQITDDHGRFSIYISPLYEKPSIRVSAAGFATATAPLNSAVIKLNLTSVSDSVRVIASALDIPAQEQGSSVSTITSAELRTRNEAQAVDVMRQLPGLIFSQSGSQGAETSLFVRGGDSKYNLVLLNGIPINGFNFGGLYDFAHIPSDSIEQIDVARGPQSAIYGSYALGAVINFTTRSPEDGTTLDVTAEGGTHAENRFAVSGSGKIWRDFGLAGSLSSLLENGPVPNSDYRNQGGFLSLTHRWLVQNLYAFGAFNSNDAGQPGAFGYGPVDPISRSRDNTSTYGFRWQDGLTDKLRIDLMTGFYLNNSYFVSGTFGDSFNKDIRAYGELRGTYSITPTWSAAIGYSLTREETRNSFFKGLERRDDQGTYVENRITQGRLSINAGIREEIYPNIKKLSPKVSAVYRLDASRSLHGSYGTGIRPPGASELAFTNNPMLKPERVESYDAGIEQRFFRDKLSLNATYFHNRYRDLIISLGGSLAALSRFQTDNLANAKAQGVETSAQLRPANWISVSGNYTWLQTAVLGVVPNYFYVGQPLIRRPKQSGVLLATVHYKRVDANITGSFRGHTLDVEPNFGAFGGLFRSAGYQTAGLNINFRVRGNITVYGNLRNALNQRYEETFGYPSPLLNVVAGVKWNLNRAR